MRSSRLSCSLALLAFLGLVGCGGAGAVGESCERPGSTEDCVDDAICATDASPSEGEPGDAVWETNTCRAICVDESDCGAGEDCRGVPGAFATRACQPLR